MLNAQDRRRITDVLQAETDDDVRKALQEALSQLDRTRVEGGGGTAISFQAADQLVRARVKKPKPDARKRPPTEKVAKVAAEALVDEDRAEDVAAIVENLQTQLNALDEGKLRPETIRTKLPGRHDRGGHDRAARSAQPARQGPRRGHLRRPDRGRRARPGERAAPLRRRAAPRRPLAGRPHRRVPRSISPTTMPAPSLAERFAAYVEAREAVLPWIRTLAVEPLAVAAHAPTRAILLTFIAAYETLNATLRDKFEPLYQRFGQDANEILGHLLLLETVVLQIEDRTYAIAAPTHPLFLWHYARYAEIVDAQRDRLDERDRVLVAQAAERLPFFLTSIFIPSTAASTETNLMYLSRLGPLPYFGRESRGRRLRRRARERPRAGRGATRAGAALAARLPARADRPARCRRLPQHARRPRRRGEAQRRPPHDLPPSAAPRSASSCGSTRPRRTGSPGSSARSRRTGSSRSRSATCRGRNSAPPEDDAASPRRRVRSEHRPDEPGARGAAPDPAARGPPPDRLPRDPQDRRAGAGLGRSVRGLQQARPPTRPGRDVVPRGPSAEEAARGAPRDRQSRPLDGGRRPPGRPRPARSARCGS